MGIGTEKKCLLKINKTEVIGKQDSVAESGLIAFKRISQ